MTEEAKIYGYTPQQWDSLPEWLQTYITESNERTATAHHQEHRAQVQAQWEQSWKGADFVLKMLITIEGGALVAIMAFLGVLAERGSSLNTAPLLPSLGIIVGALVLAVLAAFASYLVSAHYGAAMTARRISFDIPYILETDVSLKHWKIGGLWRIAGIVLAISSLALLVAGVGTFGSFVHSALNPDRGTQELSVLVDTVRKSSASTSRPEPAPVLPADPQAAPLPNSSRSVQNLGCSPNCPSQTAKIAP